MRRSYIQIDGELIPREEAVVPRGPRGPAIIGDTAEPFVSQADGRTYTSKSAYRRELRARGYREIGNDWQEPSRPAEPKPGAVRRDITQAIEQHS